MSIRRIAVVSSTFPPTRIGGVGAAHYNLANALELKGYEVSRFAYGDYGKPQANERFVHTGLHPGLRRHIHRLLKLISRWFDRKKIGLPTYTDYCLDAFSGLLLRPKIMRTRPDIVVVPDHGPVSAWIKRFGHAKVVFISHHNAMRFLDEPWFGTQSKRDILKAFSMEQAAVSNADGIVCPSAYMRDVLLRTYSVKCPVEVIPNIIDENTITDGEPGNLRSAFHLNDDVPIVYIPSAGSAIKGASLVFEIVRRLAFMYKNRIAFYLSGAISLEQKRLLSYLPKNATMIALGDVDYQTNLKNIRCCNLCVSPTLIENLSMAMLEAQMLGLPVVSFDVGGNREIVQDGRNGYIVPYLDVEQLIEKSVSLLLDKDLRGDMSIHAREHAEKQFCGEAIVDRYVSFFESLC